MLSLEVYDGIFYPTKHIEHCLKAWEATQFSSQFWVHQFFQSLGMVPKSLYVHKETRRQTASWKILHCKFFQDFPFYGYFSEIKVVLQKIKKMLFRNEIKPKYPLTVFYEDENILQYSFYPSPT